MSPRPRDGAERLLAIATAGLPAHRSEWGAAMRSELASIDDSDARRRFARSAAGAAFRKGFGIRIGFGLGSCVLVAAVALRASRVQLADGGPGVLDVTVPVPAFLLLLVALLSAGLTRSLRVGLETGLFALVASFAALFAVLAMEGIVWMDRHGVFLLDGDPPRAVVDTADIVFNIFSTGLWLGHLVLWVPGVLIGAVLGAWIGGRRSPTDVKAIPCSSRVEQR
jgi:hypothetical protein